MCRDFVFVDQVPLAATRRRAQFNVFVETAKVSVLDYAGHVPDALGGEHWLSMSEEERVPEDIGRPISRISGLVLCSCFVVNTTTRDGQIGLWRKVEGVCDLDVALDDASTKDMVVNVVAQLSGQAEKNALSLCIHGGRGVQRQWVGVAHGGMSLLKSGAHRLLDG